MARLLRALTTLGEDPDLDLSFHIRSLTINSNSNSKGSNDPRPPWTPAHTWGKENSSRCTHTCTEIRKFLREKKRKEKKGNWRDRMRKRWVQTSYIEYL